MALTKVERRIRIKRRIRKVIFGTAERPRLSVYRSNTQISAQLIDDNAGKTLVSASSLCKEIAEKKLISVKRTAENPFLYFIVQPLILKLGKHPG